MFYGVGNVPDFYNLTGKYLSDNVVFFIERNYLPIAEDSFGNIFLINIGDENYGNIVFYNHESQIFTTICDDFKTLVSKATSKKFQVRTIEERIEGLKESSSPLIVDDELLIYGNKR